MLAGVAFVALSGLRGVSPDNDAAASGPDVTASQALAGILLTLLSQFVGAPPATPRSRILFALKRFEDFTGVQRAISHAYAAHIVDFCPPTSVWHPYAAAGQMILEELLLGDVHLHPYELLGWEGLFGTVFMLGISLPIVGMIPGAAVCASEVAF